MALASAEERKLAPPLRSEQWHGAACAPRKYQCRSTIRRGKCVEMEREELTMVAPPPVAILRAARALVGVSQGELATMSGVSAASIARIERYPDNTPLPCRRETWERLVRALEDAGVQFLAKNAGVRFRR